MMHLQLPLLAAFLISALSPSVAGAAELNCQFETECLDTDGCAETDYAFAINYQPKSVSPNGMIAQAQKTDQNGNSSGLIAIRDDYYRYTSGEFFTGIEETLTVTPSRDARYTVTMVEVPMTITYAGQCEASK